MKVWYICCSTSGTIILWYWSIFWDKDAPLSDLLIQDSINTENQLIALSDSNWKYWLDTGRSTGAYIIFYQGISIDHGIIFPGPLAQSSAKCDYQCSMSCRNWFITFLGCYFVNFWTKNLDIVPEAAHLIILDIKSAVSMDNNGKDTKHNTHISIRVILVKNVENCKIHKTEWCKGGLQLADIAYKNVGETDLNSRMKYIMVRLEN